MCRAFSPLRPKSHFLKLLGQAQLVQYPRAIGADLDTSAYLTKVRGLFEYHDLKRSTQQRER